ncbi:hypothetical protein THAOC_10891 [Thalassiosira oceanica]|uniref:VTT domain-containing protein n=1 Tax=Thalassiosira oceanica TaxID=159749 RepID=K0SSM3_THAOC|nr:hypothetical protein THAOC_10891 [Thalassiosira oceanica]|eukprot:EJK67984.1 hypothetical protein THAOC_10891 [Thalassiosira oceanica]
MAAADMKGLRLPPATEQSTSSVASKPLLPLSQTDANADDARDDAAGSPPSNKRKIVLGIALLSVLALVVADASTSGHVQAITRRFLDWVQNHVYVGILAFVLVYAIATVFFVPGAVLTLGGGYVFGSAFGLGKGVLVASLAVFAGASGGAIASFLLGRYLLRDYASGLADRYPIMKALDAAIGRNSFKIFVLLRLSVNVPFNALNYISGATAIGLGVYCVTLLGMCLVLCCTASLGPLPVVLGMVSRIRAVQ